MERQRGIFNPSKEEAHKILDDNLLQSFLTSRRFLDACLRWQEAQAAGNDDYVLFLAALNGRYTSLDCRDCMRARLSGYFGNLLARLGLSGSGFCVHFEYCT